MPSESFADKYAPLLLVIFFSLVAVYGVLGFYHSNVSLDFGTHDLLEPCNRQERPQCSEQSTANFLDAQDPSNEDSGRSTANFLDVQDPWDDENQARYRCFELLHQKHLDDLATLRATLHTETMDICDVDDDDSRRFWDCVLAGLAWERGVVNLRRGVVVGERGRMSGGELRRRDARRRLWD